jgi:hypothetical protein
VGASVRAGGRAGLPDGRNAPALLRRCVRTRAAVAPATGASTRPTRLARSRARSRRRSCWCRPSASRARASSQDAGPGVAIAAGPRSDRRTPAGAAAAVDDASGSSGDARSPSPSTPRRRDRARLRGRLVRDARPVPRARAATPFAVMLATTSRAWRSAACCSRARGARRDPWKPLGYLLAARAAPRVASSRSSAVAADAQTFAGMWAMRATGRETVEVGARFAMAAPWSCSAHDASSAPPSPPRPADRQRRTASAATSGPLSPSTRRADRGHARHRLRRSSLARARALARHPGRVRARCWSRSRSRRAGAAHRRRPRWCSPSRSWAWTRATGCADCWRRSGRGRSSSTRRTRAGPWPSSSRGRRDAFRRLYIQGVSNSGDALTSTRYMRLQALLPLLIHRGEPRSALVVGFGTGITGGRLLADPGSRRGWWPSCCPSVVRAGRSSTGTWVPRRTPPGDPDRRRPAGAAAPVRRYDLITLEPPPPPRPASPTSTRRTSTSCAAAAAGRPHGAVVAAAGAERRGLALARAQLPRRVPHATAWSTELHEVLLVGSASPIELDGPRVAARYAQPRCASALAEVGIESPEALLATWVTDRAGSSASRRRAARDRRPPADRARGVGAPGEIGRVLPALLALAADVPLPPADPLRPAVEAERRELLGFYRFSLHALAASATKPAPLFEASSLTTRPTPTTSGWPTGKPVGKEHDDHGPEPLPGADDARRDRRRRPRPAAVLEAGPSRDAIVQFVAKVTTPGPSFVRCPSGWPRSTTTARSGRSSRCTSSSRSRRTASRPWRRRTRVRGHGALRVPAEGRPEGRARRRRAGLGQIIMSTHAG